MNRNELLEEISVLTDPGSVPYEITPHTRNNLLDKWIVLLGGDSTTGRTRNKLLGRILELLSLPSGSDFNNDFNNDFGGQ